MSPVQVTWLRDVRAFKGMISCGVPVSAFLAVGGWSLVSMLWRAEGSVLQIQTVWGLSLAPWLPILCAILTMRLFAEERSSGMIDLLMSSPIRERNIVIGKFFSAMTVVTVVLLISLALPMFVLPIFSHTVKETIRILPFAATFFILFLQASTWCAAGTMVSVFFRNQAASAVSSLLLCSAAPMAIYLAILSWMPAMRAHVAWMPLMLHVYDFSTGLFSTAVLALYVFSTCFFLFGCSKLLASLRLRG